MNSRSLDGARDVAAVVDARIRERAGSLTPQPQPSWAEQVPDVADPQTQDMFRALATWMDERTERLGKHAADARPEWATAALGEAPADPQQRAGWQQRASRVAAYREMYGYDHPSDPIGPEPAAHSPEQRAAWHAGLAALGPADGPDLRGLSEGELWLRRDTYQAETAWAPRHVAEELRLARLGAQNMQIDAVRAEAEAAAAEANGNHQEAGRRRAHAESARVLHAWYQQNSSELEPQDAQYREWEHLTEPSRRLAVAAAAELRRRQPGRPIEPLTSAEPEPVTGPEREELLSPAAAALAEPAQPPAWVTQFAAARDALQQALDDRKAVRVPAEDHEREDEGEAWPALRPPERDAILQPPPPEMTASPRLTERAPAYEADREAGG